VLDNAEGGCKMKMFGNMTPKPGEEPTEEVRVSDIAGIKVDEDGFTVSTSLKDFKFKIIDGQASLMTWETAFRNACNSEADAMLSGGGSPGKIFQGAEESSCG